MRRPVLFAISFAIGGVMYLIGGLMPPSPPPCPHCAVLNARYGHLCPGGAEVVQGGVIC